MLNLILIQYIDIRFLHELTNHPPHIINERGEDSPSAFIPFCELGQNMTIMKHGSRYPFSFPICKSFTPKIFYDQLCYEVDVNKYLDQSQNKKDDVRIGLSFLIDNNENKQFKKREIIFAKGDMEDGIGIN